MEVTVCGLSYRTAPVHMRERFAFTPEQSRRALRSFRSRDDGAEHLILSTCNRTELYTRMAAGTPSDANAAVALFHEVHGLGHGQCDGLGSGLGFREELEADSNDAEFYVHRQQKVVDHLFRLAAGIDSVVLGESQILRQLKDAYSIATEQATAGALFKRMFPAALRTGKKVRSDTEIGSGCTSLTQAALKLARNVLGETSTCTALFVGSGEIADATAQALSGEVAECVVINRTPERAQRLAERLGASEVDRALPWERLEEQLERVDLVISSTGSPEPVIGLDQMQSIHEKRQSRSSRPLVIVDLAVPRDFDPKSGEIPEVHLFDMDDLNRVVRQNVRRRHGIVSEAERIVESAVSTFHNQMAYLEVEPVIRHLVQRFEDIRLGELQRFSGDIPAEVRESVDELTRSIVNKLLYFPIEKLKCLRDENGLSPNDAAIFRRIFLSGEK